MCARLFSAPPRAAYPTEANLLFAIGVRSWSRRLWRGLNRAGVKPTISRAMATFTTLAVLLRAVSRLNPRTVAYRMTGHPQAQQS